MKKTKTKTVKDYGQTFTVILRICYNENIHVHTKEIFK
jgi:hypothetical protein